MDNMQSVLVADKAGLSKLHVIPRTTDSVVNVNAPQRLACQLLLL